MFIYSKINIQIPVKTHSPFSIPLLALEQTRVPSATRLVLLPPCGISETSEAAITPLHRATTADTLLIQSRKGAGLKSRFLVLFRLSDAVGSDGGVA